MEYQTNSIIVLVLFTSIIGLVMMLFIIIAYFSKKFLEGQNLLTLAVQKLEIIQSNQRDDIISLKKQVFSKRD